MAVVGVNNFDLLRDVWAVAWTAVQQAHANSNVPFSAPRVAGSTVAQCAQWREACMCGPGTAQVHCKTRDGSKFIKVRSRPPHVPPLTPRLRLVSDGEHEGAGLAGGSQALQVKSSQARSSRRHHTNYHIPSCVNGRLNDSSLRPFATLPRCSRA